MVIRISILQWLKLTHGLRIRGGGIRESGAFILGKRGTRKACASIFFDDLDPKCLSSGIIKFSGYGYLRLWKILKDMGLEVLADIHCHPGHNTNQSQLDRQHPMVRIKGHLALIAPNYARVPWLSPKQCSAYLFVGKMNWIKFNSENHPVKLTIL